MTGVANKRLSSTLTLPNPSLAWLRLAAVTLIVLAVVGCTSMKPEDFAGKEPKLDIEAYFLGETRAWGIFEDRFGTLRRQFEVDIQGTMEGDTLVLDEHFLYDDGETDRRIWRLTRTGPHSFTGKAGDTIGEAEGRQYGNAFNLRYEMNLKVGDGTWRVRFDDWMFLRPDGVLINRARVYRWGLEIGQVTLVFNRKDGAEEASADLKELIGAEALAEFSASQERPSYAAE